MAVTLVEAVQALDNTLQGLLPVVGDPTLAPEIFVNPLSTQLVGVGGVVGISALPTGEVMARRVKAQVVVRVKASNVPDLAVAEEVVSLALLGADPTNLRSQGVFRIDRNVIGTDTTLSLQANRSAKDLRFDVLYEFIKQPQAGEGVINTLPVDVLQHTANGKTSELIELDFETDPLAFFDVIDDPGTNPPGQWQFAAAENEIRQTSNSSGGSNNFNASKRGTYLLLRAAAVAALPKDFALYVSMRTDVSGGIGFVFRFQDIDNFYYCLLNRPTPYRIFGKKVADQLSFLDVGGQVDTVGYEPNQWILVRLSVQDEEFELAIDGVPVLKGRDSSIAQAGRLGFFCRNNATARFRFFRLVAL